MCEGEMAGEIWEGVKMAGVKWECKVAGVRWKG